MSDRILRLGKNPAVNDIRTLRFSRYLTPALPPPPAAVDWSAGVKRWPMYLNDRYGDCTCAAVGHMIQAWTASTHQLRTPTDAAVLALYEHFTPPGPENGCNMLDVLKYWRIHGVSTDRITGFARLARRSLDEARQSVAIFGGCYVGVMLPLFVTESRDMLATPWDIDTATPAALKAPDPMGGHCVNAVGYDATGLVVVTWGTLKRMSWSFYQRYSDESYAVLSQDFLARGVTPTGVDLPQLERDIAAIGRAAAA